MEMSGKAERETRTHTHTRTTTQAQHENMYDGGPEEEEAVVVVGRGGTAEGAARGATTRIHALERKVEGEVKKLAKSCSLRGRTPPQQPPRRRDTDHDNTGMPRTHPTPPFK